MPYFRSDLGATLASVLCILILITARGAAETPSQDMHCMAEHKDFLETCPLQEPETLVEEVHRQLYDLRSFKGGSNDELGRYKTPLPRIH